jgi:septal ring factor EnvC (AmiA/AmiB activator)
MLYFSITIAFRRTLAVAAIALACVPLFAQQSDRTRAEALERRAGARLQALQREAERLASEERTLLGDLRRLEIDRQIKAEELGALTAKGAAAARDVTEIDQQIARLQDQEIAARPALRERVVALYKLGQGRYLRLLLSMSDVRTLGQASRLVSELARRDQERIAEAGARRKSLIAARETLDRTTKELATLRADAQRAQDAAARAVAARNEMIRKIDEERDLNAQLASELIAAQQKLQDTLRDLAAGEAVTPASLPLRPFRGDLEWPVSGAIRTRGASARLPNGIEIIAAQGTPVRAVHDGTVAFADTFTGFGKLVIVAHQAQSYSLYGNLSEIGVTRGSQIAHGQELGRVGAIETSLTTEPGLYFELRVDGRPVDPLQWLRTR